MLRKNFTGREDAEHILGTIMKRRRWGYELRDRLAGEIRKIVQRELALSQGRDVPATSVKLDKIKIVFGAKLVSIDDQLLHLTPQEYDVLELLSKNKGIVVSKSEILECIHSGVSEPDLRIVDVVICRIRKKIAKATNGKNYIVTVRERGFRFGLPKVSS